MVKYYILFIYFFINSNSALAQNVGIGTTNPQSTLSVGSNSQFQVNNSGNILRINNQPISFPTAAGNKNEILVNRGNGNLKWFSHLPYGSIIASSSDNSDFDSLGFRLYSKSTLPASESYDTIRNGLWTDTAISYPNAGVIHPSNTTWSPTYNEFVFFHSSTLHFLNPVSKQWFTSIALSGTAPNRENSTIVSVSNKIYVLGGYNINKAINSAYVYDVSNNTWASIAALPDSLESASAVSNGTKIFVFGGEKNPGVFGQQGNQYIYTYDINTNTWTSAMFNPYLWKLKNIEAVLKNDTLYMFFPTISPFNNPYRIFSITLGTFIAGVGINAPDTKHYSISLDSSGKVWSTYHSVGKEKFVVFDDYHFGIFYPSYNVVPDNPLYFNWNDRPMKAQWMGNTMYMYEPKGEKLFKFTKNTGPFRRTFGDVTNAQEIYYYQKIW